VADANCGGTISANSGIGYLAMNAREFLQTDVVVVAIILYALLGKLADVSAQWLERSWLRWNRPITLRRQSMNTARLNQEHRCCSAV
jgi:ABC-type nitrate/sulfonate/bicarbonate transport system permease component